MQLVCSCIPFACCSVTNLCIDHIHSIISFIICWHHWKCSSIPFFPPNEEPFPTIYCTNCLGRWVKRTYCTTFVKHDRKVSLDKEIETTRSWRDDVKCQRYADFLCLVVSCASRVTSFMTSGGNN
jgi:hypothetical protein